MGADAGDVKRLFEHEGFLPLGGAIVGEGRFWREGKHDSGAIVEGSVNIIAPITTEVEAAIWHTL